MTNAADTVTRDGQKYGSRSPTRAEKRSEAAKIIADELLLDRYDHEAAFSCWIICYGDETNVDAGYYASRGIFARQWNNPKEVPTTRFDAAVCCYSLNKLEKHERLDALDNAIESLKTGGTLYAAFRSPQRIANDARLGKWPLDGDGFRNNHGGFVASYTWEEAVELLNGAGLVKARCLKELPIPILAAEKPEHWTPARRPRWKTVQP